MATSKKDTRRPNRRETRTAFVTVTRRETIVRESRIVIDLWPLVRIAIAAFLAIGFVAFMILLGITL